MYDFLTGSWPWQTGMNASYFQGWPTVIIPPGVYNMFNSRSGSGKTTSPSTIPSGNAGEHIGNNYSSLFENGPGPGGDLSGIVGPENGTMDVSDIAHIALSPILGTNPLSAVFSAFLSSYKGENALTQNSIPQTAMNLVMNALGFHEGMNPASIASMQAIANAHAISEAMAENGATSGGINGLGSGEAAMGMMGLNQGNVSPADMGVGGGVGPGK